MATKTVLIESVVKTVAVACTPEAAFRYFTADFGLWWPAATHSVAAHTSQFTDKPTNVVFESRVGGRIFERTRADELEGRGLLRRYQTLGCGPIGFHMVAPHDELFASMDKHFMSWNPEEDAVVVAADMVNNGQDGADVSELAGKLNWPPRRINPAVAYLVNRRIVRAPRALGTSPWTYLAIMRTSATRRFVRDRS